MNTSPEVLIVDDQDANLFVLRKTLKELDCTVIAANNGNEALATTLEHNFALALLDVQMPGMNGIELAEILRDDEKSKEIPIIFLTAASFAQALIFKGYEAGAVDYIIKPYEPKVLLSKVRVFLELQRQKEQLRMHQEKLEALVAERTAELEKKNKKLNKEIAERILAEEKLRHLTRTLEDRVAERTQELESLNHELEAFSYSVSHDLRAPLRGMNGFSKLLIENYGDELDDRAKDYLRRVRGASEKMSQLIDDLLKLSRVTRSKPERHRVNLSRLAESIAEELRETAPERKVSFKIAPDISVEADGRMIGIVLENLMGNAWKYTAKHDLANIEFGQTNHEGVPAYFVRDDGAGFDMAFADKLFEPFQRLHSSGEFEGTGIGLATVQRVVRRHGGRIWAESAIEKGTTMYFSI